ncbi:MAG: DUF2330 domain-containing protein [Polyangiales bacterium]
MRASSWLLGLLSLALVARGNVADACGGCFASVSVDGSKSVQVVTDHRMVLALASEETTLWDQIRYAGSPEGFVWVLPVPHGVPIRMGLGDNAFVNALANLSAPQIRANFRAGCGFDGRPQTLPLSGGGGAGSASGTVPRSWGGGGGVGCGGSSTSSIDYTPGSAGSGNGGGDSTAYSGSEDLAIQGDRDVVGPYAAEVISGGAGSFQRWAQANSYDIPRQTLGAVRWYEALGSDFLVLRLAPEAGVEQMQPVRITYPGYLPTLPLRMIAAGVADKVGLDLMVISEGVMQVDGFANAQIDRSQLVWNVRTSRSNYRAVFNSILARHGGRVWVTESTVALTAPMMEPAMGPGLDPVGFDAGVVERVAGWSDAGAPFYDLDRILTVGTIPTEALRTDPFVDRRLVFQHLGDRATLTRLRTELDPSALDRDLQLSPAASSLWVPREIDVTRATEVPGCPGTTARVSPPASGPGAPLRRAAGPGLVALCALALSARRWRRSRLASARAQEVGEEAGLPVGRELIAAGANAAAT